jgi:WD40 repeat protein
MVLWEVASGRIRAILKGNKGVALCLAFAPDGRTIVTVGLDGTLRFWHLTAVV